MAMVHLTKRELFIINKIYSDGYSERDVGEMLKVTQQSIHVRKNIALKKLRTILTAEKD